MNAAFSSLRETGISTAYWMKFSVEYHDEFKRLHDDFSAYLKDAFWKCPFDKFIHNFTIYRQPQTIAQCNSTKLTHNINALWSLSIFSHETLCFHIMRCFHIEKYISPYNFRGDPKRIRVRSRCLRKHQLRRTCSFIADKTSEDMEEDSD